MQSDYFRLCYTLLEGGLYVDSDDVYHGSDVGFLFGDGRLKIQPLCYDMSTDKMVPHSVFTTPGADSSSWIFYFNNNPLVACRGHPIIRRALTNATLSLERHVRGELPDIQSTTGPGNLTKSVFEAASKHGNVEQLLHVLRDWEGIATTKWPLSYRQDERKWRISNRQSFRGCLARPSAMGSR